VQHRPDNAEDPLDLWWPLPPRHLDPAHRVQQVRTLVERRRYAMHERERTFDQVVRGMARHSVTAAPPTFTESVRRSLVYASIAPVAPQDAASGRWQLSATVVVRSLRALPARHPLSERQRRAALGGAGTMALVLVFGGLSVAVAPAEILALMGVFSALIFATVSVGHLLSAAMNAIMGTTALAVVACLLYAALAVAWVRLVRQPVEV
jgi:hypothetical protein